MITVKQFLTTCGLATPHERIKLVRHSDHMNRSIRQIVAQGIFDRYQAEQHAHVAPFDGCDVIASFIAAGGKLAELHGVYRVGKSRPFRASDFEGMPDYLFEGHEDQKPRIWYDLEPLTEFDFLRGRLVAKWSSPLRWHMSKDQELHELRAPGRLRAFPGYQDVILSWSELKGIWDHPAAHSDWMTALKFTAAIYRIVDLSTGMIYIGSAYGKKGLWNRWRDYAKTGHGGNKKLIGLDYTKFQWSIVRTISGVMSERDVILLEQIEKAKHGSRAVGLNAN